MEPEFLIPILVTVAIESAAIIVGIFYFLKRFPVEKLTAEADANSDNAATSKQLAEASAAWLDNHNKMFAIMQERDAEMVKLGRRVLELEEEQKSLLGRIDQEVAKRKEVEANRLQLSEENLKLRAEVSELRVIVNELKNELATLRRSQPDGQHNTDSTSNTGIY